MSTLQYNFKKSLFFEITLVTIFLLTFYLYFSRLLPEEHSEIIFAFVGFIGLYPVVKSALTSLKEKRVNVDLLATIALVFSFLSEEWGSMLFINLMLSGARMLDIYTRRRVHTSLESLAKLKPLHAHVIRNTETVEVPISEVVIGDSVVVNLGEQIPVDGTIIEGEATINQASLTGESIPVFRTVGTSVLSATVVMSGNITVRTERTGAQTTFEKMIKLVDASSSAKTRMRTLAEKFASWYISIMLVASIVIYLATNDLRLVLAVVLVVCADDIAIAVPIAYIAAMGTAARRGIIIKSADFLELASKITTLVVDKTGTLTLGNLFVTNVSTFAGFSEQQVLEIAGSICGNSNHPVSVAIKKYAEKTTNDLIKLDRFQETSGRGLTAFDEHQKEILMGRSEFIHEHNIHSTPEITSKIEHAVSKGSSITLLSYDGKIIGIFALADQLREGVTQSISALKHDGIKEIIMLTGDNDGVAKNIARRLGIDKYYSKLLPEHKLFVLNDYIGKKNRVVAMVGDGVNDAAVLSRSDLGIAMGQIGTDVAIESADVVLMQDRFEKIIELRNFSKKVRSIVHGNFIVWGVVNALGLYLVFTRFLDPAGAAAYNFLTDFIPIANSLRLFRSKV